MLLCRLSYRPTVDPPGLEPGTCRLRVEVTLFFTSPYQCGRWGSNPRHLGGSQGCSRYPTSTKRVRTKRRRKRPQRAVEGNRSIPRLRITRGGTRRSRTCCLPGFNRALIRMSLSSTASRREESNLHHVVPNHACSRYTASSCATLLVTAPRRCRMAALCSFQGTHVADPNLGMRQHGGKGSNPHHPGWSRASWPVGRPPLARAHQCAAARTNRVGSTRRPFALAARETPTPLTAARRSRFVVSWCRS